MDEAELRTSLDAARRDLTVLGHAFVSAQNAYNKQSKVVEDLRRKLKRYPSRLYWSAVSLQPWPMDIVRLITDYHDIAETLYRDGRPSCRLMIQPHTLAVLHIKYLMRSRDVARSSKNLQHWLKVNAINVSSERPKWKRFVRASSLEEMATHFRTRRFTVAGMVLTLLGPAGIIAIETQDASALLDKVGRLADLGYDAPLEAKSDSIIVAYKPVRDYITVLYGGRRNRRRIIKTYM